MNSEINYILELIDAGVSTDDIRMLREHFWSDGRIDPRSAAYQTALLTGKNPLEFLAERAKELEAKAKACNTVYVKDEAK